MKSTLTFLFMGASLIALGEALAIGFEVDTPLDPFLGGISKFKRHILRRLRGLDGLAQSDQATFFFGQPSILLPPSETVPQMTSLPPLAAQLPIPVFDQRRFGLDGMRIPIGQQFADFNRQLSKPFQSLIGARPERNVLQQIGHFGAHCSAPFLPVR